VVGMLSGLALLEPILIFRWSLRNLASMTAAKPARRMTLRDVLRVAEPFSRYVPYLALVGGC